MPRQPEGFEYRDILKRGMPVSNPAVIQGSYEQYQEYLYRGHTVMLDRRRKIVAGIFASAQAGEQPQVVYLHPSLGGAIRLANWVRFC